jgi:hypothetical protein
MDEEIEISLKLSRQQREKIDQRRNRFRRCQRQEDEFLLCKYRSLPLRDSNHISFEASENGNMLRYVDDQRTIAESTNEMDRKECVVTLHDSMESFEEENHPMESSAMLMEDDAEMISVGDTDPFEWQDPPVTSADTRLHQYTNVTTDTYCRDLLKTLRNAKICKSQSNVLISLLKSVLPEPNNMPSSLKNLLAFAKIENIFTKRKVYLECKLVVPYDQNFCERCQVTDQTKFASIYDVDVNKVLFLLIRRLSKHIEEYKRKIVSDIEAETNNDIPFGMAYRELLQKKLVIQSSFSIFLQVSATFSVGENLISLILHLDGVSLTKSTKLKLWLFSGSIVELPPSLRSRRHNMVLLSVWVGYTEPVIDLWLDNVIDNLQRLKENSR